MTIYELKAAGWIAVEERRPPMTGDTPSTDGFFLVLCHDEHRDAPGQYRLHLWFGSVTLDARFWHPIPAYK
jgi:hypothetical protein